MRRPARVLHLVPGSGEGSDLFRRRIAPLRAGAPSAGEGAPGGEAFEHAVAAPTGSAGLSAAARLGLPVVGLPAGGPGPAALLRAVLRLAREVGGRDLLHAHTGRALRLAWAALAASGAGAPVLATRDAARPPRRIGDWRRADLVLVPTDEARDALVSAGLEPTRVRVGTGVQDTLAAYGSVLDSARRRREHAAWMARAGRTGRALPAEGP